MFQNNTHINSKIMKDLPHCPVQGLGNHFLVTTNAPV